LGRKPKPVFKTAKLQETNPHHADIPKKEKIVSRHQRRKKRLTNRLEKDPKKNPAADKHGFPPSPPLERKKKKSSKKKKKRNPGSFKTKEEYQTLNEGIAHSKKNP